MIFLFSFLFHFPNNNDTVRLTKGMYKNVHAVVAIVALSPTGCDWENLHKLFKWI